MAHAGNAPVLPGTPPPIPVPSLRRFQVPDFSSHGRWMGTRLLAAFPHLTEGQVFGWLSNLVYSPEYMFVTQNNSCALAQTLRSYAMSPHPIIQEHFVFARERENPAHLEEAAEFYAEFLRWGAAQDADTILLSHASDVPEEQIRKKLGAKARVLTVQQIVIKRNRNHASEPTHT